MVKLFTVHEMQALEKEANDAGLTYDQMMENAGKGLGIEIQNTYNHLSEKKLLALVGSGNNGGDTLVALNYLQLSGWTCIAFIVRNRSEDDELQRRFLKNGGQILNPQGDSTFDQLADLINQCTVVVDGIFGTGIRLPLKEEVARLLLFCKKTIEKKSIKTYVVAVDCPSGVDCDSGEAAEETLPADMTVTMAGIKAGLLKFPAAKYTGELRIVSIGLVDQLSAYNDISKIIISNQIVKDILPKRPIDAHKGTFGTALIIAGSINYTGAALLAGLAAYRSGTGLVTMAVPAPLHSVLAGQFPEGTWLLLPDEMGRIAADGVKVISQNLSRVTAILLGPGMGLEDCTSNFVNKLLVSRNYSDMTGMGFIQAKKNEIESSKIQQHFVIDADGLKLLSKVKNWHDLLPSPAVLTPHPGEMSVLTGLSTEEIQADRLNIAVKYSHAWNHVVVLKGAFTIIAAPDGQVGVIPIASAALARAGTGDVLAGLIVGLRAQGVPAFESASAGAWIHANAGLLAAKRLGNTASIIASDVLNAIPQVISEL
jgi:ADP-dependent NAD(P)H-hydrate dehydratase / NAD(P)H-hydrate epimerase